MDVSTILRQSWRRVAWRLHVRRDRRTGLLYYTCNGRRLFIRARSDYLLARDWRYACEHVFFRHHVPLAGETMVDIGAGFGEESLYLPPSVRYIGVEIQPTIYEHLANTLRERPLAKAVPFAIASAPVAISSCANYLGVNGDAGYIEVPTLTWREFTARYGIGRIDLLKVNIEGAEADFLSAIDLRAVQHLIVSTHDFRADRGHGEHFRTRWRVQEILGREGFTALPVVDHGSDWALSWLYAHRVSC